MLNALFDMPEPDSSFGFAGPLTEEAILRALGEQMDDGESGKQWVSCRPVNARFQPSRSMTLAVALLDDAAIPEDRYWPQGRIVYLHGPVRPPMSRRGQVIELNGQPFEAYTFPNDRRLRSLRTLAGSEAAAAFWSALFSLPAGATVDIKRQLLRYAPEHKFVARLRDRASDIEQQHDGVAVRVCDPGRAQELAHRHKSARKLLKNRPRSLDVPRMIGGDPDAGIVAVEWIKGDGLLQTLAASDEAAVLGLLAEALHDFHQMAMPGLPAVTAAALAKMMREAAADLGAVFPDLAPLLAALPATIATKLRSIDTPTTATIHNDFYFDQVRVRRHRCTIVDLERVANGDPLIDVAHFVFQMRMLSHRPQFGVAPHDACRWADLFLEQWQLATGQRIDPERMAVYSAIAALVLARGVMRHLRPEWKTLARQCVTEAEAALAAPARWTELG